MAETLVVTDGTDSFYGSRKVFQSLYDYGEYEKITAFSSSVADAKKMCLSRQARYSGLIDVLEFAEGGAAELSAAFGGASTWVAVNADEGALLGQLEAAASAGVKRAFVHLSAAAAGSLDEAAIGAAAGPMTYTVMRTGSFAEKGSGGGLLVGEFGTPTCDEVPADDAFRFISEAVTIEEAYGRSFSLCPCADASMLKEMRMAGCTRREEAVALLQGVIVEKTAEEIEQAKTKPKAEEEEEVDTRSEEEIAADREEEIKRLMVKVKQTKAETEKRVAEEQAEKEKKRAERMEVFAAMPDPDEIDAKKKAEGGSDDDEPPPPPETPSEPDDKPPLEPA